MYIGSVFPIIPNPAKKYLFCFPLIYRYHSHLNSSSVLISASFSPLSKAPSLAISVPDLCLSLERRKTVLFHYFFALLSRSFEKSNLLQDTAWEASQSEKQNFLLFNTFRFQIKQSSVRAISTTLKHWFFLSSSYAYAMLLSPNSLC